MERDTYRKPEALRFGSFARSWLDTYPDAKGLKRSTRRSYEGIVEKHLIPEFDVLQLADVDVGRIDSFLAKKLGAGLAPATLNRSLNVLSLILRAALTRGLVRVNAVSLVDRPREVRRNWRILAPVETVAVERAFDALILEAGNDRDRDDRGVARLQFLTHMATGIRAAEAGSERAAVPCAGSRRRGRHRPRTETAHDAGTTRPPTTQRYMNLSGESFRDEADLLERRLWDEPVESSGKSRPTESRNRSLRTCLRWRENAGNPHG